MSKIELLSFIPAAPDWFLLQLGENNKDYFLMPIVGWLMKAENLDRSDPYASKKPKVNLFLIADPVTAEGRMQNDDLIIVSPHGNVIVPEVAVYDSIAAYLRGESSEASANNRG